MDEERGKYHWKNRTQHIFFFIGIVGSMRNIFSCTKEDTVKNKVLQDPELLQILIVIVVIGGPLVFLEHFIGQFTQKCQAAIGSMLTAAYGFGFCMMLLSFFRGVLGLYYAGHGLFYVLVSLINFSSPPWMMCPSKMPESIDAKCFSMEDIDNCHSCLSGESKPCYDPKDTFLSAYVYKINYGFSKDRSIKHIEGIGPPQLISSLHIFLTFLLVAFVSHRGLLILDWSLRISLTFSFFAAAVSMVVVFTNGEMVLKEFDFNIDYETYINPVSWLEAVRRVNTALNVATGEHIALGSYMTMKTASHFQVCYLTGYFLAVILFGAIHHRTFRAILACRINNSDYHEENVLHTIFVMYPTVFGQTAVPQLWCTMYFTVYFILNVQSLTIRILLLEKSLSDELHLHNYSLYIRFIICLTMFLLAVPLTGKGSNNIIDFIVIEFEIISPLIVTMIFVIIFLYGVQRFSDDIHFVLQTSVAWYIGFCWIVTPLITGVIFVIEVMKQDLSGCSFIMKVVFNAIFISPLFIAFIIKLLYHIRKQNITGIFRPAADFGAPDFETRLMRVLFNPRQEVRYVRRFESCKHQCLLNNKIAMKAIEMELILIYQIAFELDTSEELQEQNRLISKELHEHYAMMKKSLVQTLLKTKQQLKY